MSRETLTPVLEPEVEVSAKARQRTFTAESKRQILKEADACTKPGEVGALLRREGLYSSHLRDWRAARERGEIAGLSPEKRGRKPRPFDPRGGALAFDWEFPSSGSPEDFHLQVSGHAGHT